ncbi:hypothetical protein N0V83_001922 [Neocucurbitaria cava]|uniref:Uncharacterized protein n=1 Tax=Neocucurbitaria cava TaxID=798079 RepID=A0A9W9CQF5_9PLEO|nr:hypothetical protein N0V83_001922 [Neocucurbitaria cava]
MGGLFWIVFGFVEKLNEALDGDGFVGKMDRAFCCFLWGVSSPPSVLLNPFEESTAGTDYSFVDVISIIAAGDDKI